MASKRRQRRRQCERKTALTKDQAYNRAVSLRNTQKAGRTPVDAYPCPLGDHWHVGHRPASQQRVIDKARAGRG